MNVGLRGHVHLLYCSLLASICGLRGTCRRATCAYDNSLPSRGYFDVSEVKLINRDCKSILCRFSDLHDCAVNLSSCSPSYSNGSVVFHCSGQHRDQEKGPFKTKDYCLSDAPKKHFFTFKWTERAHAVPNKRPLGQPFRAIPNRFTPLRPKLLLASSD